MPKFSIRNTNILLYINDDFTDLKLTELHKLTCYKIRDEMTRILYDKIHIVLFKQMTDVQCIINIYINGKFSFSSCYSK